VSTLEREVVEVNAPLPSTSMALVPLTGDRGPRAVPAAGMPSHLYRYFYGIGYAALAMMLLGAWLDPLGDDASLVLFGLAVVCLAFGGLGVLIHTGYKPNVQKLRRMLGAIASLVLAVLATGPVESAAREVHASRAIAQLQPLAEQLARDGRIRTIGIPRNGWVELNGYQGALDGSTQGYSPDGAMTPLAEVLQRDGISRLELVRLMRGMRDARVTRVETGAAYVVFDRPGVATDLLYLRPGQPLPPPRTPILERPLWQTQPMGGGWYLFLPRAGYR
jgi:uncharacterized membrane protein